MKSILKTVTYALIIAGCILLPGCSHLETQQSAGTVFTDEAYTAGVQIIPGKVQCEYYDVGGEGITYHDSDGVNSGSGQLNPADGTYLHEFRKNEAVDTSYTKSDGVDDNEYNFVQPQMGQLYIGWTEPGEWINYSVNVQRTGTYVVGVRYTANGNGAISLSVDGTDVTGPLVMTSTHRDEDQTDWRQWHHWNEIGDLARIELKKGSHVLTLHTVANGNMNYDYMEFTFID